MTPDPNLVKLYRDLLNHQPALEAEALADKLSYRGIITDEENSVVKEEKNFSIRQYLLFLRILPNKTLECCKTLIKILEEFSCTNAAEFLKSELHKSDLQDVEQASPQRSRPMPAMRSIASMAKRSIVARPDSVEESYAQAYFQQDFGVPQLGSPDAAVDGHQFVPTMPQVTNFQKFYEIKSVAAEFKLEQSLFEMGPIIGDGSFANVYLSVYKNQRVAVKQFIHYDEFALTMFFEEVFIMSKLHHPNVVHFQGFVHSDHVLWLISEYIQGGAMRRFCEPSRSGAVALTLKQKIGVAIECWQGLDYLHTQSLCHKDISPGNILVSDDLNHVKISDFGLAEFKQLSTATLTGLKGTAMYYPPEFASELGYVRHPILSDVYSMGASLCELFSEQWFWNLGGKRLSDVQVMFKIAEQQKALSKGLPLKDPDCKSSITPQVWNVIQWAVNFDLNQRKSSSEMLDMTKTLL